MKIAFTGNPNSGKTTMFNALTGRNEKVGNWAGVTVEKKQGPVKKKYAGATPITAVDLPGAYSISPYTAEEAITRGFVLNECADIIINVVDATNLSRSLFFTTQLLELGVPVVVALNKSDVNQKKQTKIDLQALSAALHCPVVETVSTHSGNAGLRDLITAAIAQKGAAQIAPFTQSADLPREEADRARFAFVNRLVAQVEQRRPDDLALTVHDKADRLLTNKWLGIALYALVMWLVFQISQGWLGPLIADNLTAWLEQLQAMVGEWFTGASPLLYTLLIDGVLGGAIAVIGFLPLVMVLYFLLALLEDCGYMARVAVVLDPIFKKVGLSGKSVIPFVVSVGCAVPGVMAARTIRSERERRATVMLSPFMPCGAKIPVISLFAGAFFEGAAWVSTLSYLLGIVIIFFGALLVNRITGNRARGSYFIMELPEYKIPSLLRAFLSMCQRGWSYVVKAATVILLCNTAVQLMQSFTFALAPAEAADASILAYIAQPFAYLLLPIVGVLSWQLAAAAITGFIAKENVVGTLAVCFVGLENFINTEELAMLEGAGAEVAGIMAISKVSALAYLLFNLFSPPCFAAIGAMRAEMKSAKWLWAGIGLQLGVGYTVAYLVYTVGTLLTAPAQLDVTAALGGLAAVVGFGLILTYKILKSNASPVKER